MYACILTAWHYKIMQCNLGESAGAWMNCPRRRQLAEAVFSAPVVGGTEWNGMALDREGSSRGLSGTWRLEPNDSSTLFPLFPLFH